MRLTQPDSFGCSGVYLLSFIGQNKVKILSCRILHTNIHFLHVFVIFRAAHFIVGLGILKLLGTATP